MSSTLTLDKAKAYLRGVGAEPIYFGDADEAWCCYGRTATAGLITITFGHGPTRLSVGTEDYFVTDRIDMATLIDRHVPTRAKLESAAALDAAPRKKAAPTKWVKNVQKGDTGGFVF
jgi:hypothetical protein